MNTPERPIDYIPALRFDWLTNVYDLGIRWTLRETHFKRRLLDGAALGPGATALDVGCGTGTLLIAARQRFPGAALRGVDGDANILKIAREKAAARHANVEFDIGLAYQLPYPDNSFDAAFSTLVFHHLNAERKRAAFSEIRRVLRPGGTFHLADFGAPENALMRLAFLQVQLLDGFETTQDNAEGRLPDMMRQSGFAEVVIGECIPTFVGTVVLHRARK
jgi:ubiquinone/menaquinone biosynthesis C-methylase UbiE